MNQDLDFAWCRSGGGQHGVGFTIPHQPFEVGPPLLEGLDEHQARIWETLVQLGCSRAHTDVEDNVGCKPECSVMGEDTRKGSPPAARAVYLNSAGSERGHRARLDAGPQ